MKICDLSVSILRDGLDPRDNRQQCALVTVTAEDGTCGYAEASANPAAVKALLESDLGLPSEPALRRVILGAPAEDPAGLWGRLKTRTYWSSRAGIGHVASAAVSTAAWDLAGKLADQPTYLLLGEPRASTVQAYCTIFHGAGSFSDTMARVLDSLDIVVDHGFRAVKVEPLAECAPSPDNIVEMVRRVRERLGDDFLLMADVGYRWQHLDEALQVCQQLDEFGLFALEAPFAPHNIGAYTALSGAIETPLCTGDILTSGVEYLPILESGAVAFVQGGAHRTGIGDMNQLAERAAQLGKGFVPLGWVGTALTTAANLHMSLANDNVPLIEYDLPALYPEATMRNKLFTPEPAIEEGHFKIPTSPGLGMNLDPEVFDQVHIG